MPGYPDRALLDKTRRLIGLQIIVGLIVVAGFFLARGRWEALSAGYGGMIGVLMTQLLGRGIALAGRAESVRHSQAVLYAGAVVRFILVLVLFAVGLAGLGLAPLATVMGFIAVQMMFPLLAVRQRRN